MADAPSAGGGISGAEIAVIAVLVIGALATLSGHPLSGLTGSSSITPSSPSTISTSQQQCGITLSRPTSKESTGAYATVVGSITPCTITPVLAATVNMQVVDSTGALMSAYTTVNVAAASNTTGTFSANIPITGQPAAGTGYVIVTGPIDSTDGTTMTARAPVHFVGTRTPIIYSNSSTGVTTNTTTYYTPAPTTSSTTTTTTTSSSGGGTTF
jgi:hypothetical protein